MVVRSQDMALKSARCSRGALGIVWSCTTRASKYVAFVVRQLNGSSLPLQAMRFPLNAHRKDIADAEGAREREKELAKEIQDGEINEEDALGGDF